MPERDKKQFVAILNRYFAPLDRPNTWLAKQVGVNKATVGRWFDEDDTVLPSLENLNALVQVLKIDDEADRLALYGAAGFVVRLPSEPASEERPSRTSRRLVGQPSPIPPRSPLAPTLKNLFDRAERLLVGHFDTEQNRLAVLEWPWPVMGNLLHDIEWEGAPSAFTANLVRKLHDYGDLEPGRPALVVVMEEVRPQVGLDVQAAIDRWVADYLTLRSRTKEEAGAISHSEVDDRSEPVPRGHTLPNTWQDRSDALELEYLRSWFGKPWANVRLAEMLEEQDGEVSLLDIYVPLPVDCTIMLKTESQVIVDWWVRSDEVDRQQKGMSTSELAEFPEAQPAKLRRWADLDVDERAMQTIVDGIQGTIEERQEQGQETKDDEHAWFMEAHDAASVQARFVLLGDPGSGKSSFLRHLALCLAGEMRRRAGDLDVPEHASLAALRDWLLDTYTPVYIELRDLVRTVFPDLPADETLSAPPPQLDDFWRYVREELLGAGLFPYETALRTHFAAGTAILLLDGLDEIGQAADRRRRDQVKAMVAALIRTYPNLRIIVTSRPHAYQAGTWALDGFGRARLEPLSLGRLEELALALFSRVGSRPADAENEAAAFASALRTEGIEPSFHANPLFFTMLAALWLHSEEPRALAGHAGRALPSLRGPVVGAVDTAAGAPPVGCR